MILIGVALTLMYPLHLHLAPLLLLRVVQDIADYVHDYDIKSDVAYDTARLCLMDSLGCHMEALRFPSAAAVCGPVVEGTVVPNGAKVREQLEKEK
jgi:2-methylcitrate dehydratase PrpD